MFGDWHLLPTADRSRDGVKRLVATLGRDGVFAAPVFVDDLGGPLIVTPDILLRFDEDVPDIDTMLAGVEILERDWAGTPGAFKVRVDSSNGFDVLAAAEAISEQPGVRYAEVDFLFTGRGTDELPTDGEFGEQWGMHSVGQFIRCGYNGIAVDDFDIDAPEAWCVTHGDPSILIAVLDDGIQLDHPDLIVNLATDVTSDAGDGGPFNDCDNHGTTVAGNASALLNDLGVVGAAPGCGLMSARTFISNIQKECDSGWMSQASWTVESLQWAYENGARITNNSNAYGFTSDAIEDKYQDLRDLGVVHFAAAGNNGAEMIAYPANLETVNAIGMTGPAGILNANSNYGEGLAFVAPGAAIYTTDRTGDHGAPGDHRCSSGTSHASPTAAGVAALVLSMDDQLSTDDVEQILRDSALDMGDPGFDIKHGWGMVNAADAVALASACPADCDENGVLNILDFVCYQNLFAAGDPGADCDGNGQLNVLDFVCYQNEFQAGCE